MTDIMSGATNISDPSQPIGGNMPTNTAAPGATGPGGQMSMGAVAISTIGLSAAALIALGIAFRVKGKGLPPLRIDALNALNIYFSWLVVHGTVKMIAYRYHGHKWAQAYILIG
jgi:hypothetical protein